MKTKTPEVTPTLKVVIIYDSIFGNTEKIAEAIKDGFLSLKINAVTVPGSEVNNGTLDNAHIILFGSPTRAFRPTPLMTRLVMDKTMKYENRLVTVFDTRFDQEKVKSKVLLFLANNFGFASSFLCKELTKRKATIFLPPQGFLVSSAEGPLKAGEVERAFLWAKAIVDELKKK
jgi:flavodoxin